MIRHFIGGVFILADRLLQGSSLTVENNRISAIDLPPLLNADIIDPQNGYLSDGFIDLHVHGGAGDDLLTSRSYS